MAPHFCSPSICLIYYRRRDRYLCVVKSRTTWIYFLFLFIVMIVFTFLVIMLYACKDMLGVSRSSRYWDQVRVPCPNAIYILIWVAQWSALKTCSISSHHLQLKRKPEEASQQWIKSQQNGILLPHWIFALCMKDSPQYLQWAESVEHYIEDCKQYVDGSISGKWKK